MLVALRISRRRPFVASQPSGSRSPIQGRSPKHCPSLKGWKSSSRDKDTPQSQTTRVSLGSALVLDSSSHICSRQPCPAECRARRHSMSCRCPFSHPQTKRIGDALRRLLSSPRCSFRFGGLRSWKRTSRRRLGASPGIASQTNHLGNTVALMPSDRLFGSP